MSKIYLSTSNISSVLSQVTGEVRDHMLTMFPKNYFKDIIIRSEDQSVADSKNMEEGRGTEFMKRTPALSILPVYSLDPSYGEDPSHDPWMNLAKMEGRLNELHGHYPVVFSDLNEDNHIFTLAKKHKMTFDVSMRVNTELEMWDCMSLIKNSIDHDQLFYLKANLAVIIPNVIIYAIATQYDLNLNNTEDREEFLEILQNKSYYKISHIIDPSKGDMFYTFNFPSNVLTKISLPSGSRNKKDFSTIGTEITLSVETQMSIPTNFVAEAAEISDEYGEVLEGIKDNENTLVRSFTAIVTPPPPQLENGKSLVFYKGFVTDAPDLEEKELTILSEELALNNLSSEVFINNTPNITLLKDIDLMETSIDVIYSPDILESGISVQKITVDDGKFKIRLTNTDIVKKNRECELEITSMCNRRGEKLNLSFGKSSHTLEFTQPHQIQKFKFDCLSAINVNDVILSFDNMYNTDFDLEDKEELKEFWIIDISIKEKLGKTLSTSTEDILDLSGSFNEKVDNLINENIESSIDNNESLDLFVYQKNGKTLDKNSVNMNWKDKVLTLDNPLFNTTHYLAMYAHLSDLKEVNEEW